MLLPYPVNLEDVCDPVYLKDRPDVITHWVPKNKIRHSLIIRERAAENANIDITEEVKKYK